MDFQWTGLDYQQALKRMGGNEKLYSRMLESFVQEYKTFPERLKEMVQRESDEAYVLTHSLKNISASIGAQSLSEAAEEMEGFFREGIFRDTELYRDRLTEEFQKVYTILETSSPAEKSDKLQEHVNINKFIVSCRSALSNFSPSEIKKCRRQLQESEWPEALQSFTEPLLESLKTYQYQRASGILERMEKQAKAPQT